MSCYEFIAVEKAHFPVTLLCRVLQVARSGYYAWCRRGVSARMQGDQRLSERIRQIHLESRASYGAPRIHATLRDTGTRCGRKRVARLMRADGLVGCHRRRRVRTTVADPQPPALPNLVNRDFVAAAPDRLWVGDITFIPTWEGWLYLAVLLDAGTRRVVGWAMAEHLRTELAIAALQMALTNRCPAAGLIHHTDRGSQYTAQAYQARLAAHQVRPSLSRAGDCYDNALAESFIATLKMELISRQAWPTRGAARQAIFEWIEVFYNRQRRHSSLGYLSPNVYEAQFTLPHDVTGVAA
jgi:putative transposase